MANKNQTTPRRIAATERRRQALELRKAGFNFEEIAAQLGYAGRAAAYTAVKTALKNTLQQPADELRETEEKRLDAMLKAIWPNVLKGRLLAVDRALRISGRRAALWGLDAPIGVEQSGELRIIYVNDWRDTPTEGPPGHGDGHEPQRASEILSGGPTVAQDDSRNGHGGEGGD